MGPFIAIVPAYNEAKHITAVAQSLLGYVDEVVVVDDCSSDDTAELARAAGATVLSHTLNRGQGAALETGQAYARERGADYVLHFDGDGQFDVADIHPALLALKASGADILFGSRFLDTRSHIPWFKRQIVLPVGRYLDRILGGVRLTDAHNGFRLLRRTALEALVLTHDRMAHASEIPGLVKKHGLTFIEFPVKVTYHQYGQSAAGGITIIKDLVVGRFIQ